MNIAICEDNAADTEVICAFLRRHLDKHGFTGDIHTFDSGEALLAAFAPGAFDVVFLDIYMGGLTGMETAQKMRSTDPDFALVFITGSQQHAMEAFAQRACAYVPKPITPEAMETAFTQCQAVFLKNARFIEIMTNRQTVKVPLSNIYYIEVYDKDVLFHTTLGVMETHLALDAVEAQLGQPFLRCHRSYLINLNHIHKIREQDILMRNGHAVPMRQRGRSEIRAAYGSFLSNRLFEVT